MVWRDFAMDLVGATLLGALKGIPFLGRAVEVVSTVMERREEAEDKRRLETKVDLVREQISILGKQQAAILANQISASKQTLRPLDSDCLVRLPVAGETTFQRRQREAVEGVLIEVLAKLRLPELDGTSLDQVVRELRDIHEAGYGVTLFEGLFGGTAHYDMLQKNPGLYGRVLDDGASLAQGQIPIILGLDKPRILEVPAMSLAALLRSARRDPREIVAGNDMWALPRAPSAATGPASVPSVERSGAGAVNARQTAAERGYEQRSRGSEARPVTPTPVRHEPPHPRHRVGHSGEVESAAPPPQPAAPGIGLTSSPASLAMGGGKDQRVKAPVLRAKYKCHTLDDFIEKYSRDISRSGMWINTTKPPALGTLLKVEIMLDDGSLAISAVGRIVKRREDAEATPENPPGMGIRFLKIMDATQPVIDRIVALKGENAGPHFENIRMDAIVPPLEAIESDALDTLETMHEQAGDFNELADVLRRKIVLATSDHARRERLRKLARISEDELGDRQAAAQAQEAIMGMGFDHEASLALERIYLAEGRWRDLADLLHELIAIPGNPTYLPRLRKLAELYAGPIGDVEGAVLFYRKLLDFEPNDLRAREALEAIYERGERWGDLEKALHDRLDVAASAKERAATRLRLAGLAESRFESNRDAVEHLREVLHENPTHTVAGRELERLFTMEHRWSDLGDLLERRAEDFAAEGDTDCELAALVRVGELNERELKNLSKAMEFYERVLVRDPDHVGALRALAPLVEANGDRGMAARMFRRALDLSQSAPKTAQSVATRGSPSKEPRQK